MPEYRVTRSFGGNTRGQKVELSAKDAQNLLDKGYVSEIQTEKKTEPKKS